MDKSNQIRAFIQHWSNASASERSNSQLFLIELCDILELPHPDPHLHSGYAFEFPVDQLQRDHTTTQGRIDLYKRGCFVLESKQFHAQQAEPTDLQLAAVESGAILQEKKKSELVRGTERWDDAILAERRCATPSGLMRFIGAVPRVARHDLPWVTVPISFQPHRGCVTPRNWGQAVPAPQTASAKSATDYKVNQ